MEALGLVLVLYAVLSVLFSFAIVLMRKREMIVLLKLSFLCIVTVSVLWLFNTVPLVGMHCVIVVFLCLTH